MRAAPGAHSPYVVAGRVAADTLYIVVPGLVPGTHVHPQARPLPAHTAMPQDVDGRDKPGHDVRGGTPIAAMPPCGSDAAV